MIEAAFKEAHVQPETLSYIETHGTGTSLGDPIEIRGLTKAFGEGIPKQSIPIGSVKSNMGHLESAAGMAALTKVLLQLKHQQLIPSIFSETTNPNIDFSQTPFYVQHEVSEWKAKENLPRRAGISSFGAGGSNAHLLLKKRQSRLFQQNKINLIISSRFLQNIQIRLHQKKRKI